MEGNHSFNPETRNIENEGFQRQVKERFTFIANENIILDYFVDHQIYGKTDFILTNWALRIIVHNWIENNKDFTIPLKCIISIDNIRGSVSWVILCCIVGIYVRVATIRNC